MTIGDRIREQRLKRGMTLLEVADYLGVKEATVQRYESGNIKTLKQDTIGKLADILQTSPTYLMGWEDDTEKKQLVVNSDHELIKALNERPLLREFVENLVSMDDRRIAAFITALGLSNTVENQ